MPSEEIRAKKYAYWEKLWGMLESHEQVFVVSCDNVGSALMQNIRHSLRGKAEMLFGKNTLIRAGLKHRNKKPESGDEDYDTRKDNWAPLPKADTLEKLCNLNVGFVFCKSSMSEVV